MFSMFLLKQVKYFLDDKNACVILCEFLNKVYIIVLLLLLLLLLLLFLRLPASNDVTQSGFWSRNLKKKKFTSLREF